MKTVVFGFLGSTMDAPPPRGGRWDKWRPTIALCQHEGLVVDKFVLFYQPQHKELLNAIRADLKSVSPETILVPQEMEISDPWDLQEVYTALLDFSKSYPFDTATEQYLVHITTGTHIIQICLYLLVEAKYFPARLLQTSPAKRSSQGPGSYELIDLDLSKYDGIWARFQNEKRDGATLLKSGIETKNQKFNAIIGEIEQVATSSNAPILLTGPTGVGKSLLASKIFQLKKSKHRIEGNFVEVNCATLRGDSAMSTLFGHVKGAFTGAIQERHGLLRKAHKGLLFLDEIGELGTDEQAMLLRAIEEKKFFPFGSDKEISSDFQLISGTNRELNLQVSNGKFREDLLARINLWTFQLPGLANRREDIAPNLDFELDRFSRNSNLRVRMNAESKKIFLEFAESHGATWSGNFRDLNAAVSRMATLAHEGNITKAHVIAEIERLHRYWNTGSTSGTHELITRYLGDRIASYDLFDTVQLERVLRLCISATSISDAGRQLFQVSRTQKKSANDADRLVKYLARFGLSWEEIRREFP
jgi:transcriptional regulatory protein RtcR